MRFPVFVVNRYYGYCMSLVFSMSVFFSIPQIVYAIDTDNDGLDDTQEQQYYTDPNNPDTDGDGFFDGVEISNDYSPHKGEATRLNEFDYDNDGLNDWLERWFAADMGKEDSNSDGMSDYASVMTGVHPTDPQKTFTRRVVVDKTQQRLYYYVDKVKIHNWPVSTGNPKSETPSGTFTVERMIDNKRYVGPGYDLPNVAWNIQFKPMYYIHAAYWHNDFGIRTHSHGCVNMKEADVAVLYRYLDIGVPIDIIGETPKRFYVGT